MTPRVTKRDRGSAAPLLLAMAAIMFVLTLVLVDGAAKRQAGIQAHWYAAEAARAGVAAVGPRPDGVPAAMAAAAAQQYLTGAGVIGSVAVLSPSRVRVTAVAARTGPMSGVQFSATRSVTADLLVGVETGLAP